MQLNGSARWISLYTFEKHTSFGDRILQIKNGISPELFTEIFARERESHYDLRRCNDFRRPSIRTVYHGSESISFLGPKI